MQYNEENICDINYDLKSVQTDLDQLKEGINSQKFIYEDEIYQLYQLLHNYYEDDDYEDVLDEEFNNDTAASKLIRSINKDFDLDEDVNISQDKVTEESYQLSFVDYVWMIVNINVFVERLKNDNSSLKTIVYVLTCIIVVLMISIAFILKILI